MSRRVEGGGPPPAAAACAGLLAACGFVGALISLTPTTDARPEARGVSRRGTDPSVTTSTEIARPIDTPADADGSSPTAHASGFRTTAVIDDAGPPNIDPALAVGTWTREATGLRTLTIRPDGTATLHIAFDWLTALAMGPEVTLSIRWAFADGVASFETVGGEPAETARFIAENYGTSRLRPVTELTSDRFVLGPSVPGEAPVTWRRVDRRSESIGPDVNRRSGPRSAEGPGA